MEILLGLLIGAVFFIATITAYSFGVRHGRIVKSDGVPNVNPIKAVKAVKNDIKQEKQLDVLAEGLQNILSYGEVEEVKSGR